MTGVARRTLLIWLLAMLAGLAIVWNSRFVADMSFFLPGHPSACLLCTSGCVLENAFLSLPCWRRA